MQFLEPYIGSSIHDLVGDGDPNRNRVDTATDVRRNCSCQGVNRLAILSRPQKQRLLLLHTASAELFAKAFLTGMILTAVFGVLTAVTYLPEGELSVLFVAQFAFLALWTFGGLILRTEYSIASDKRTATAIRAPILATLTFFILLGITIVLYQQNPNTLWLLQMLNVSFVLPVLVLFAATFLLTIIFRSIYMWLVARDSDLDLYGIVNSSSLPARLDMFWEYARRYSENLYLALIRVSARDQPDEDAFQAIIDYLLGISERAVRKADLIGQIDRSTLWLIFSRTLPEHCSIPIERVVQELESDKEFQKLRNEQGLQIRIGLAGYVERMESSRDLRLLAEEALSEAVSENQTMAVRGIPHQISLSATT